jgi:hypothetical protein
MEQHTTAHAADSKVVNGIPQKKPMIVVSGMEHSYGVAQPWEHSVANTRTYRAMKRASMRYRSALAEAGMVYIWERLTRAKCYRCEARDGATCKEHENGK